MIPRPYQAECIDAVFESFQTSDSTLVVMATGTGKTVVFSHIINRWHQGRVMVIAHREELINQAIGSIGKVTGDDPDKEMASSWADRCLFDKSKVVVSSIQTQQSRMDRFNPDDFGLLIIDEAHHAVAKTYRKLIEHYKQNPRLKVLGVTATPDRADEKAMGNVFESVSYVYDVVDAIRDGWLVPIHQSSITVEGLDYSGIRTTAGDLNGADLEAVMLSEKPMQKIAGAIHKEANGRRALVFDSSVEHARRMCEILNRIDDGCARFVCGKTPKDERKETAEAFSRHDFHILCNVGVYTEGYDEPRISLVGIARPTKSRSLYCQMIGRGTRPLPGIVDCFSECGEHALDYRKEAIAASPKPSIEVLDFVGTSGKHKLVTVADVLGGNCSEDVVKEVTKRVKEKADDGPVDVDAEFEKVKAELEAERLRHIANRSKIIGRVSYVKKKVDPFDVFDIAPVYERGWSIGKEPTEKMVMFLEKAGVDVTGMSYTKAGRMIQEIKDRWDNGKCSFKQAKLLARYGYGPEITRRAASAAIDAIAKNGWKLPAEALSAPVAIEDERRSF